MSEFPEVKQIQTRLAAVEETIGYLEVDDKRVHEQMSELSKVVHDLSLKLVRLESRLVDLHQRFDAPADPGLVAPPHSAGPDITRDPI